MKASGKARQLLSAKKQTHKSCHIAFIFVVRNPQALYLGNFGLCGTLLSPAHSEIRLHDREDQFTQDI